MVLDKFINNGFDFIEKYIFNKDYVSYVFSYEDYIIIVDYEFDNSPSKIPLSYFEYCDMQNNYMKKYGKVLRYNFHTITVDCLIEKILLDINKETVEIDVNDFGGTRNKIHYDNTLAEKMFEDIFLECYGMDSLEFLYKEEQISTGKKTPISIDYMVETKSGNYAFEANGITYHSPCCISKEDYDYQLERQNILVMFGFLIFRFSTDEMNFKERAITCLKNFLCEKKDFISKKIIKEKRIVENYEINSINLYEHQREALKKLDTDRKSGKNVSLIVFPTGTGKSHICIEDLKKNYIKENCKKVLILVPSNSIKNDWINRIQIEELNSYNIDVLFYNAAYLLRNRLAPDYYDYIIFDEAHHACAANCRATIQYFKPKYLIGLTATPDRLDGKKLNEIFGSYSIDLSLKEAIEQDLLCDISAFRIKSNINLADVRYDGVDYNYSDLEKRIVVDSRNDLIADTVSKYFKPHKDFYKQGIVFCINKAHAVKVAKKLRDRGISAEAVYSGPTPKIFDEYGKEIEVYKDANRMKIDNIFEKYKNKKIQFLCSCQLISEGWDSPQTEVIVMARPTLSKVLYMQQLGRGTRKFPGKECLFLFDIVDEYGAELRPWSFNSLFGLNTYKPGISIKNDNKYIEILGLNEYEYKVEPIDIFTFEEKYKNYLSLEQAARELYVDTGTLRNWLKKDNNIASLKVNIGRKMMPYFSIEDINKIRKDKKLKVHTEETILEDFLDFISKNDKTYSYKYVFIINALKMANNLGEIKIDKLTNKYAEYYINRAKKGLIVENNKAGIGKILSDFNAVKNNMLSMPCEKFERKRFILQEKDLNIIAFNPVLWSKLNKKLIDDIINKELVELEKYFKNLSGIDKNYKF